PVLPPGRGAPPALPDTGVRALVPGGRLAGALDDEHLRSAAVVRGVRRLAVLRPHRRRADHRPRARLGGAGWESPRPHRLRAGPSVDDRRLHRDRRRHCREQLLRVSGAVADRIRHPRRRRDRVLRHAMRFPELAYIAWAKAQPAVDVNLARSGIEHCPVSLLKLRPSDVVATLPVKYGYAPLREAIARRYGVAPAQVFPISGGTSFANWLACAAILDGCDHSAEVIVERPTYEPLVRVPQAFGHRLRRLDRRFNDDYRIDLDRFGALVSSRTKLAIVTNLHNPSGARIPLVTLREMAAMLARVRAYLLVDEVYLECLF